MRLFHGTTRQAIPLILKQGLKMTPNEVWPEQSVCALDSLDEARAVAAYFGKDGVVIELEIPESKVLFHPDYGQGPEFDTVHIMMDVPPSRFVRVIDAPADIPPEMVRPAGTSLRDWKKANTQDFRKRVDDAIARVLGNIRGQAKYSVESVLGCGYKFIASQAGKLKLVDGEAVVGQQAVPGYVFLSRDGYPHQWMFDDYNLTPEDGESLYLIKCQLPDPKSRSQADYDIQEWGKPVLYQAGSPGVLVPADGGIENNTEALILVPVQIMNVLQLLDGPTDENGKTLIRVRSAAGIKRMIIPP